MVFHFKSIIGCALTLIMSCAYSFSIGSLQERNSERNALFSTPGITFSFYSDACKHGNWRTFLECHSPAIIDRLVYEAYSACNMAGQPEALQLLTLHGAHPEEVVIEYKRLYKQKYGIDIDLDPVANVPKSAEKQPLISELKFDPPEKTHDFDRLLFQEALVNKLKNKSLFYEAVQNLLSMQNGPMPCFGPLELREVQDAVATGLSQSESETWEFHFQKDSDGWRIDQAGPVTILHPTRNQKQESIVSIHHEMKSRHRMVQ